MSYKIFPTQNVKLNLPITYQLYLSVILQYLILKIILFRCSVNNTNWGIVVQTGRCVQCTVQSFIEKHTVAYFLNKYSFFYNPSPITAFTRTNNIMQFLHTDRTNSVHLAAAGVQCLSVCSCSFCTTNLPDSFYFTQCAACMRIAK